MLYFYHIPKDLLDITPEDKIFLNYLLEKYAHQCSYLPGSSFHSKFMIHESSTNYSNNPIFKKIAYLFRNTKKHHDYMHVYKKSQILKATGSINPHVDVRSCVFTIPLSNVTHPCHFYDDSGNEVASYYYTDACMLNGWAKHGVPENTLERYFFQVGGFGESEQIEKVVNDISR